MHRLTPLILALAAAGSATAAGAQSSSTGYGSAIYQTVRNCPATPSVACNGIGSGQGVVSRAEAGGGGQSATLGSPNSAFAYGNIRFGSFGFPEIKASVNAAGLTRIGDNIYAYQNYVYTGAAEFDLLLSGNLHIVNSTADNSDGTHPGGAIAQASFAIWNKADFDAYAGTGFGATAASIYGKGFLFGSGAPCSAYEPGDIMPRAATYVSRILTGGETNLAVAQQNCNEDTLTLFQGDEFVIATAINLFANRGGAIDATGTFTIDLSPETSAADAAAFRNNVTFASGVPEPATWAMMIGGFGLIGGGMRRRRASLSFAAG